MLALACAIALDPASYNVQNGAHIQRAMLRLCLTQPVRMCTASKVTAHQRTLHCTTVTLQIKAAVEV
eukprot:17143-Heterococcus_DN1.PRE.3